MQSRERVLVRIVLWTVVAFGCGAMPLSVWLGQLILGKDIRSYGDGNPGAANAWRAGSWRLGAPAVALDYLKAAVPVGAARFWGGVSVWALVAVALAPVVGHAFSPWLRFRGGKAVAVTFGVWTALSLWEAPTVLGFCLAALVLVQSVDAWSTMLGMLGLLAYLLWRHAGAPTLAVWAGNALVLAWKHHSDLARRPRLRPSVLKALGRRV